MDNSRGPVCLSVKILCINNTVVMPRIFFSSSLKTCFSFFLSPMSYDLTSHLRRCLFSFIPLTAFRGFQPDLLLPLISLVNERGMRASR